MLDEIEVINALKNKHEQCFSLSSVPQQKWFGVRPSRSCTANVLGIFGVRRQEVYSAYLNANGFNHDNQSINTIKQNQLLTAPLLEAFNKIQEYQLTRKERYFGIGVSDNDSWNIFCEELKYRISEISKLQDNQTIMNELTMASQYINEICSSSDYLFPNENIPPISIGAMLNKINKDIELANRILFSLEQNKKQSKLLCDIALLGKSVIHESFSLLTILCSSKSQQENTLISCIERLRNCSKPESNLEQLLTAILDTPLFTILLPSNPLQIKTAPQRDEAKYAIAFNESNPLIVFDTTADYQTNDSSIRIDNFKLRFGPQTINVIYGKFPIRIMIDLTQRNNGVENNLANDHEFLKKVMIIVGVIYELAKILVLTKTHIENSSFINDPLKFLKLIDYASCVSGTIAQVIKEIFHQCSQLYKAAKGCQPYQTTDQKTKFTHVNVSQEWQKNYIIAGDKIEHLLDNLSDLRNKIEQLKQIIINGMPQDMVQQLNDSNKITSLGYLDANFKGCHKSQRTVGQPKINDQQESDQEVADVMRLNIMTNVRKDLENRAIFGRLDDRSRAEYVRLDQQIEHLERSVQTRYK